MAGRKAQRKPLSFSTTLRNPERIAGFLHCLLPYEGQILTHDVIMEVIANTIREKVYSTNYIKWQPHLLDIYKSESETFTDAQIEEIIRNSPQIHKEAGFEEGWESRFDTFYKLPMEFGFVSYEKNQRVHISQTGHMMIEGYLTEERDEEKIRNVFLNALMKYQTNNPFRKNANDNVPLILLLQVLKMLKADKEENGAGVFRQELSLFICWPDSDAGALYRLIKQIRREVGYSYSDEYIYDICLGLLGASRMQERRFKMRQICGEAVDEYIRKMRMTGIISLRGNGRFIDYNVWETEKIDYILTRYSNRPGFTAKEEYFSYMGMVDEKIVGMASSAPADTTDIKQQALYKYARHYTKDTVFSELKRVCSKRPSSEDSLLKLLPGPVRLEFLTSIALVQNFRNLDVVPNYVVDDEGLPTGTAAGGRADIVCGNEKYQTLVEVSLMCGRQEQLHSEIVPIRRHLLEEKKKQGRQTFAVFMAPVIHEDTQEMAAWYKVREDIDIIPLGVHDFTKQIQKAEYIEDLLYGEEKGKD